MKKIFNKCFVALAGLVLFAACTKEKVLTYMDVVTFPAGFTASTNNLSLSAANLDSSVITFSWPAVQFKVKAPVTYSLQLDLPTDTVGSSAWNNAVTVAVGSDVLSKSFTGTDLNTLAMSKLGLVADSAGTVVARVVAVLDRSVYSNVAPVKVKPYKVVVKNVLYVPGDYQSWNPATASVIAEFNGKPKMYEGYVYMSGTGAKGFKYTNAPDWNHINYGDGGNGALSTDGNAGNLTVSNGGYYELTANLNTSKWTAIKTTWSIIGDATPGGWSTDTQMTYDAANQVWKVTANMLASGSFKFRANNAWVIDFGIDSNKKLVYADNPFFGYTGGLDNLSVPSDGNYTITLDLHSAGNYTYDLHKN
jgi:hypothetical protein